MADRQPRPAHGAAGGAPERPRDPQSFTRGDRRAIAIVASIGLGVTVVALGLFVGLVVVPAL